MSRPQALDIARDIVENSGQADCTAPATLIPVMQMGRGKIKNMHRRKALVLLLAAVFSIAVLACGSDSGGSSAGQFQQVQPFSTVLSIEDLKAIGFKASKSYDIEGLTGAVDAWLGFWGPGGKNRKDYEVRFYPSHEVAVSSGTAQAIEGTGDEFEATRRNPTWASGVKDRWRSRGVTDVSSPGSRQAPGPSYLDYAIFGNIIMLCEGLSGEQSLETCEALEDAITEAGA